VSGFKHAKDDVPLKANAKASGRGGGGGKTGGRKSASYGDDSDDNDDYDDDGYGASGVGKKRKGQALSAKYVDPEDMTEQQKVERR
jgi:hypothetical protein